MKQKISTQLATGFALIVLITVLLIGAVANGLINRQFERYVALQRKNFSEQLAESLPSQYDERNGEWNVDYIHGIGMYALKDGYLIRLLDRENHVVWAAENHDMTLCHQVMQEIRTEMEEKRPQLKGEFSTYRYDIRKRDAIVGYLDVSYYSPYYFNESDFRFLDSLNRILIGIGLVVLTAAVAMGTMMAKYMGGGKKSPAERLRDKLIEKGFDAFIYESPLDALAKRAAAGEKVDINMYFAGKTPIKEFVENQDLIITLVDIAGGFQPVARPGFGMSKGGGEIPWYVHELPVIVIGCGQPFVLADIPQARTYINTYDSADQTFDALIEKLMSGSDAFIGEDPVDAYCGLWDTHR